MAISFSDSHAYRQKAKKAYIVQNHPEVFITATNFHWNASKTPPCLSISVNDEDIYFTDTKEIKVLSVIVWQQHTHTSRSFQNHKAKQLQCQLNWCWKVETVLGGQIVKHGEKLKFAKKIVSCSFNLWKFCEGHIRKNQWFFLMIMQTLSEIFSPGYLVNCQGSAICSCTPLLLRMQVINLSQ